MRKDIGLSMLVKIYRVLVTVLAITILSALSMAQSTTDGAIGGTVFDTNGAIVPNAQVVVHNDGTNAEQTVTTDASGNYRVNKRSEERRVGKECRSRWTTDPHR